MKQLPYYTIDFSASACLFEIRVNDYPVIIMNMEGQVSSTIPINFAILKSGVQSISITMLPLLGDAELDKNATLKFDIKRFDVSNDFVFKEMFGEYQSPTIDDSKKLPIIKYKSTFTAEIPYELEAWQNGEELKDIKDVNKKLSKAYSNLIEDIKVQNYNSFLKAIANREANMVKSMYLSKNEALSRTEELIQDFKSGFQVMSVSPNSVLHICGNGRVASFRKPNGESALCLFNDETQEELMLDVTFYIPKGKIEFEVI